MDGRKMSKSFGNVVNPDEMVAEFGADALRLYEMFLGPIEDSKPWNTESIVGTRRFVEKVWKLSERVREGGDENTALQVLLQKTIKKVTEDISDFHFNTAVSSLMILVNEMEKKPDVSQEIFRTFLILLSPFAPHIAEELWEGLGNKESIFLQVRRFQDSRGNSDDRCAGEWQGPCTI
ncbi:MAG: class I tRNA ligase family protein [Candidatus Moraniibacteriota bacterium]